MGLKQDLEARSWMFKCDDVKRKLLESEDREKKEEKEEGE